MPTVEQVKTLVKEKYGHIATTRSQQCCCSSSCCCSDYTTFSEDYSPLEGYYDEADLGLGCGVPTQFAQISKGDVVLDLGSGAGNDVFVARALVGEQGKVIGVDMTAEMVNRARQNQQKLGYHNIEFHLGEIEALPLEADAVDVVLSNCVLNLAPDKLKAFQEIYRVLKPGGHFCISDIVLQGELPEKLKSLAELYAGCVAGALQKQEYLEVINQAGLLGVELKKERRITLSEQLLRQVLSDDELETYRHSGNGVLSVTLVGNKLAS